MNLIKAKAWADEMDVSVTVCNLKGIIVYMNKASILSFHKYGGEELIGKSLLNCHKPESQQKIKEMIELPHVNSYQIEKENQKQMIHQLPWSENGKTKGIIELSFHLPASYSVKK
jgi:PAS domain S-box-containing protein